MSKSTGTRPEFTGAAVLDRVAFWNPLPSTSNLSPAARALLREADANLNSDQLESALDATFGLNAIEPDYVPGFIRAAEILIATNRRDHARRLLRSIKLQQDFHDSDSYDLELSKLQTHVDPDPDRALALAKHILEKGEAGLATPYIPSAIDRLSEAGRLEEAAQLAAQWVDLNSSSPLSISYLVRLQLTAGGSSDALKSIRRFRDAYDADAVWPENIVVSALIAIASDDLEPKWMAAGPVCQGLRTGRLDYKHTIELLEFLGSSIDSQQRALLFAGLLALNANDLDEARAIFQTTSAESPTEMYLRNVALERVTRATDSQTARYETLREVWESLRDPQVAALAETGELFDPPATRNRIGIAIARILQEEKSYAESLRFIDELVASGSEEQADAEVIRLQAEILGQSGSRNDALRHLENLVQRQEKSHKYADAVQTLDSMIRLIPGNIHLRARYVDNCLKIGKFEPAIDQLVMQARLLQKAGKLGDAEPPIHRAIEVATMTNNWEQVSKLHRLLISFAPEETRLRHAAVTTYVQYGRTSEAMHQLREIVRIARKQNDLDEAIAASHQMLALDPNDPATYHQLGELLISIQEYGQADRVYRRLGTLAPDDTTVKAKRSAIAALTRSRQASR
ncbi:MAG: tetratricopeptide repeat protein [Thermomicrobiaceae bacterium]